ncbi:hypothetical protein KAH81_09310 [bacterium]|nr:hypothetical protein [bacterium]
MSLKTLSLAAICAVIFNFVYRIIATFMPGFFENFGVAVTSKFLSIVALAIIVLFFISFREHFKEDSRFSTAALFGIVGSATVVLPRVLTFLGLILESTRLSCIGYLESTLLLMGSIVILVFYVIVYREFASRDMGVMKKASFLALLGSIFSTIIIAATAFNLYSNGAVIEWIFPIKSYIVILLIAMQLFSSGVLINFFAKIRAVG